MHDLLGAPAPTRGPDGDTGTGTRPDGTPVGPPATSSAARGLCQAWASDKSKGVARDKSVAFANLASAAGGAANVDGYCTTATTAAPLPTKTANPHVPTAKPTKTPPTTGGPNGNATTKAPTPEVTHHQGGQPQLAQQDLEDHGVQRAGGWLQGQGGPEVQHGPGHVVERGPAVQPGGRLDGSQLARRGRHVRQGCARVRVTDALTHLSGPPSPGRTNPLP